jgi:muramoyltetrapeptide carboxypeptidase
MPSLLPQALRPGDEVAVIAPAGAVRDAEACARGLQRLVDWGLRPTVFPGAHGALHWPEGSPLAADDATRLQDLQTAFAEPRWRAVFCVRGGYGTTRLLRHIDWSALRRDPKPIVGYSDVTALLAAASKELGLVGFHGPMVATTAALDAGQACWEQQRALLFQCDRAVELPLVPATDAAPSRSLVGGAAEGPLVGGNLSLVAALLGTPWQIDARGAILCLEDIGEPPYRIDRMLTQLRDAGVFAQAAAVALGDFRQPDLGPVAEHAPTVATLRERLGDLPIPVAMGLPFGHRKASWTLPIGATARLEAAAPEGPASLRLLGPAVAPRS